MKKIGVLLMLLFSTTITIAQTINDVGSTTGNMIIMAVIMMILGLTIYIYTALAYMKIAKKTQTKNAWMAWIPILNLVLMAKIAGMHWWPVLLPLAYTTMFLGVIGVVIAMAAMITLAVFAIIWNWKIFEKVGMSGWWALSLIIPIIGNILFLIGIGIAAWGEKNQQPTNQQPINNNQQANMKQTTPVQQTPQTTNQQPINNNQQANMQQ